MRLLVGILFVILVFVACLAIAGNSDAAKKCANHVPGRGCQDWQYRWQVWLPDKWQRIGACETGYGKRPGNWKHHNSQYSGAFGFAHSSWSGFKPYAHYPRYAYLATPWQQYQTALAIYRRYGLSGWGCRGA